jgi:hypothetical protein
VLLDTSNPDLAMPVGLPGYGHLVHVVFLVCGIFSLLFLAASLPDGGWRRVLPMFAWFAVMLPVAGALPTTAARMVALVVTFAGALWLRNWTARRFPTARV